MNRTDRIIGACIEPICTAEDVAVRILDGLVACWDRLHARVCPGCRWAMLTGGDDE